MVRPTSSAPAASNSRTAPMFPMWPDKDSTVHPSSSRLFTSIPRGGEGGRGRGAGMAGG